ncbi:MAG TPA: NYN domain-containing protein [Myxococcota bacterium]|nr:NYN domain-containing protein [Myxococcota bacterium]
MSPTLSFAGGVARALVLIAAFPAAGLAVRAGLQAGSAPPTHYPPSWMEEIREEEPELWLVDGFNVVQVALLSGRDRDGWWNAARREELLAQAARLTQTGAQVEVVFDGARAEPEGDGAGPRQVFAESADAWLVARVRAASDPARVAVVTADRRLAGRVRHHGARVVGPGEFLRRCRA